MNPSVNSTRRKKKRKSQSGENLNSTNPQQNPSVEWKSEAQQQIYSAKLIQALRRVRLSGDSPNSKRVHEAADRALAATAKAQSRWSRAIFSHRLKLKFMKKNNIVKRQSNLTRIISSGSRRPQKKSKVKIIGLRSRSLPAFHRKARYLGRLVPGCRKQSLPVVLEEATDYIAALQMQVKAMSALADLLSASSLSSSYSPSSSSFTGSSVAHNPFSYS